MHFADVHSNYDCKPGQGDGAALLEGNIFITIETCKMRCAERADCVAIDYSRTCRLYGAGTFNPDPGSANRIYCELEKSDQQSNYFVKRIFNAIFSLFLGYYITCRINKLFKFIASCSTTNNPCTTFGKKCVKGFCRSK